MWSCWAKNRAALGLKCDKVRRMMCRYGNLLVHKSAKAPLTGNRVLFTLKAASVAHKDGVALLIKTTSCLGCTLS